jgi:hypothetical protein
MNIKDIYNTELITNYSYDDEFEFLNKYYELLKSDINYKDSEYINIFSILLSKTKISQSNKISLLKDFSLNKDFKLLDKAQEIFQIEIALLNNEDSLLNNNLKRDKKIIINCEFLESLTFNAFSQKNIKHLLKKIIPTGTNPLFEKVVSSISSEYNHLIDLKLIHKIFFLSVFLQDSEKIESAIDSDKSKCFDDRSFLYDLSIFDNILSKLSLQKKELVLKTLVESAYPKINLKDLLLELDSIKNLSVVDFSNITINSFHDIHAYISKLYRKIQEDGHNIIFPHNKMFENLSELDCSILHGDDLELILPKDKYELISWGESLNNCLASYNTKFLNQDCILIGIKNINNEKIKYALEIEPVSWNIIQFVGTNNDEVDISLFNKVTQRLNLLKNRFGFKKLNFDSKERHEIIFPKPDDSRLRKFGFLKPITGYNNVFFPDSWNENGVSDITHGLYVIQDNKNILKTTKGKPKDISELINEIRDMNDWSVVYLDSLFFKSHELGFKRDLTSFQITTIHNELKKHNKKIFLISNINKKPKDFFKNSVNYVLNIYRIHTTDDEVQVKVYSSILQKESFIFSFIKIQ